MGRAVPKHLKELQVSMDWENPEWRNKFWTLMSGSAFPILQRLDEAGRVPDATPERKADVGRAIKKVLETIERDFGRTSMSHVVGCVSKLMGRALGPLHCDILEKLEAEGVKLRNITEIIVVGEKVRVK